MGNQIHGKEIPPTRSLITANLDEGKDSGHFSLSLCVSWLVVAWIPYIVYLHCILAAGVQPEAWRGPAMSLLATLAARIAGL